MKPTQEGKKKHTNSRDSIHSGKDANCITNSKEK